MFSGNSEEMLEWLDKTKKDEYVVSVVAKTTCSYCKKFKPTMEEVHDTYKFDLYWFDTDTLNYNDKNTFLHTYDLENYKGTPYTFVTRNGKVIGYLSGNKSEKDLVEFLYNTGVIE